MRLIVWVIISICTTKISSLYTKKEIKKEHSIFNALGNKYTPRCLWVFITEQENFYRINSSSPYLVLQDNIEGVNLVRFINENAAKVSVISCVTYFMVKPPSQVLMSVILDPYVKKMKINFVYILENNIQIGDVLLSGSLIDEENVAAAKLTSQGSSTWEIYNRQIFSPNGSSLLNRIDIWSEQNGFLYGNKELFPDQMSNFYGKNLDGVTLDFRPFTDYTVINEEEGIVQPKPSLDFYILDFIAQKLNFKYTMRMSTDRLWGFQKDDGHWTGVVGDVEMRRANFSLVLSVTFERTKYVDFTRVYYLDPLSFVTSKNRPEPQWKKLIQPFSGVVWVSVLFIVTIGILIYYLLYKIQKLIYIESTGFTFIESVIQIAGLLLTQSLKSIPANSSGRIFLAMWVIFCFLVTTYYKTSLMAVLAVPSIPPTINTLLQLLNSDLGYGMIDAKGSEYQLFSTSNVKLYQDLFAKMTFYSSRESMELVAEGKYAYIYFRSNIESMVSTQYTSSSGETSLHIAAESFFPGGYGFAFPKDSPYRRPFDDVMLRCMQAGLIDKWLKDLKLIYQKETQDSKTPEEKAKEKDENKKRDANNGLVVLSVSHLQGIFFALVLGWIASILCFVGEVLTPRTKKHKKEQEIVQSNDIVWG